MTYLIALLAAYVPVVLWVGFFYGQDRYHPLPKRFIVTLFLLGLGATAPASWLNGYLESFGGTAITWIAIYILSAALEESMKLGFGWARVVGDSAFVEVVDGMVALTTIGLGFAAAENTRYVFDKLPSVQLGSLDLQALGSALIAVAPQRGVISTLGHVAWSGIVGYALAGYLLRGLPRARVFMALALAAGLHATFNTLVSPDLADLRALDPTIGRLGGLAAWALALGIYAWLFRRALNESPYRMYQLRSRLVGLPVFSNLSPERLAGAAARLVPEMIAAGHAIARQGTPAERFYVVVEGRFRVTQRPAPGAIPRELPALGAGDVFGQVALLTNRPTTADVVAETDGMVLSLDRAAFDELVGGDEPVRQRLLDLARGQAASQVVGAALRQYSQTVQVLRVPGADSAE